jgi:hypothetical protein
VCCLNDNTRGNTHGQERAAARILFWQLFEERCFFSRIVLTAGRCLGGARFRNRPFMANFGQLMSAGRAGMEKRSRNRRSGGPGCPPRRAGATIASALTVEGLPCRMARAVVTRAIVSAASRGGQDDGARRRVRGLLTISAACVPNLSPSTRTQVHSAPFSPLRARGSRDRLDRWGGKRCLRNPQGHGWPGVVGGRTPTEKQTPALW